jgi:uncharacterized BrkB/YihY/UPF0761 family membrane protein
MFVYYQSAERTGSLWDCGEFILGAYKLQVVHPPGASLFLLVGRLFTAVAEAVSDNPSNIAFAVNLMSSMLSAFAAVFFGWIAMIFGKISLVGRDNETDFNQNIALIFVGLVTGLASAFSTTMWFSAVEGEVYATSTFFTALTVWAAVKWYNLPNESTHDRWLVLALFSAGLSTGVHLLSLLTLPALAALYYFKKYEKRTIVGLGTAILASLAIIYFVMKTVIVGIPTLWSKFEIFTVNTLGLPVHSGLVPTILLVGAISFFALRYTHQKNNQLLQTIFLSMVLIVIASTTVGVVVIRANADTPINMNTPDNVMRLIPYLNREQYGERPLLKGPHFDAKPVSVNREARYGLVGKSYKKVDEKLDYVWNPRDNIFLPRIGHQDRPEIHNMWKEALGYSTGKQSMSSYNWAFLFKYQVNWMYWRYFMWNFVGRQNADQGYMPWNVKDGNWLSGIKAIDEAKLYNQDKLPDAIKDEESRNTYYFLPLIFGLIGLLYHFRKSKDEFLVLVSLFLITGLGIIIYSNQPPNEPRERDYVLVGSILTFCVWIGLAVLAIYELVSKKMKSMSLVGGILGGLLVLTAPLIMGFKNYNDHSRKDHTGARDYASNFLNSVEKNAIIFTYGDNDTYPLWYAQEVENIRRDVRVVNLSLIAVDWYINKLRNKVNDSPPIKLSIPADQYLYKNLNQVMLPDANQSQFGSLSVKDALNMAANGQKSSNGLAYLSSSNLFLTIDKQKYIASGMLKDDPSTFVENLPIKVPNPQYLTKDDIAILDILATNINERPIYFSVTCKNDKLMGLNDYMQSEGLALRIVPIKSVSDVNLGIYGSGRVDTELAYNNIMTKWKWGGFDKKKMFVDRSYLAAVQAKKYAMLRTGFSLLNQGDTTRAVKIINKYFEAFPNMNFRYDASTASFINILVRANAMEDAKKHIRILAEETRQHLEFYESLDADDLSGSFSQDYSYFNRCVSEIKQLLPQINDPKFTMEIDKSLGKFSAANPATNLPN